MRMMHAACRRTRLAAHTSPHAHARAHTSVLVVKRPWPSAMRTLAGDQERFENVYYGAYKARSVACVCCVCV